MGKLEDMEKRIDDLSTNLGRRVDALEDKVFPARRTILARFKDGPLRGEARRMPDCGAGEFKVPLAPVFPATTWAGDDRPLTHAHVMTAVYRPYGPTGYGEYEYRLAGYECSGGH